MSFETQFFSLSVSDSVTTVDGYVSFSFTLASVFLSVSDSVLLLISVGRGIRADL